MNSVTLHSTLLFLNIPFIFITSLYNIKHILSYVVLLLITIFRILFSQCPVHVRFKTQLISIIHFICSIILYNVENMNAIEADFTNTTDFQTSISRQSSICMYFITCFSTLSIFCYEFRCIYDSSFFTNPYNEYKFMNGTDTCSICLLDYKNGDKIHEYKCKHIFHKSCSILLKKTHIVCPLCRSSIC